MGLPPQPDQTPATAADLDQADLTDVHGLSQSQLDQACGTPVSALPLPDPKPCPP